MLNTKNLKQFFLIFSLLLVSVWSLASINCLQDGNSNIVIKQTTVQGVPKTNSIQASINGHVLSVVFLENLGEVVIEITTDSGVGVDTTAIHSPNGVNFYITDTGSYVVTFYLPNGDEYYGEFDVTD